MEEEADFSLIMISAMYENGGNVTHRMLDGHPELSVYPFESQLGTSLVSDYLTTLVPFKYRWPEFPMSGDFEQDYELIYDEELKTRLRTPTRSKFRDAKLDMNESDRKRIFCNMLQTQSRTRANIVAAFFKATFDSWKNLNRSGREKAYVGYSPVIVLDTEKIFYDFPTAHIIHVVRNPFSAYTDTKKRPFPLSLYRYVWTWNFVQLLALTFAGRFPANFHILRYEDLISDGEKCMSSLCSKLGLTYSDAVLYPSWNRQRLESVYPWGTIAMPSPESNEAAMNELSENERHEIRSLSATMLKLMGYENF